MHPEPADSALARPDPAERKRRLVLLCALDRAHLRLAMASPPRAAGAPGFGVDDRLQAILAIARFLPGGLGRWSRHITLVVKIFRSLS